MNCPVFAGEHEFEQMNGKRARGRRLSEDAGRVVSLGRGRLRSGSNIVWPKYGGGFQRRSASAARLQTKSNAP